jgi:hypothetical protein
VSALARVRTAFLVASRGGDGSGVRLLSRARLAVRPGSGPRARWVPEQLERVGQLLARGHPLSFRFPDRGGAWYALGAAPLPSSPPESR